MKILVYAALLALTTVCLCAAMQNQPANAPKKRVAVKNGSQNGTKTETTKQDGYAAPEVTTFNTQTNHSVSSNEATYEPPQNTGQYTRIIVAIIMGLQTLIFIGTVYAICQQTKKTERVIREQTDANKRTQRAWILAHSRPKVRYEKGWWRTVGEPSDENYDSADFSKRKPNIFGYRIKNLGKTPGRVTMEWSGMIESEELGKLPSPPPYFDEKLAAIFTQNPTFYVPGQRTRSKLFPQLSGFSDAIAKGEKFLYIFGIIKYIDAWEQEHETRFCFLWYVPEIGKRDPQGWYVEGPEEYTRCT